MTRLVTKKNNTRTNKMLNNKELEFIFHNIGMLNSFGITLLSSIEILRESTDNQTIKQVFAELFEGIKMGKSISDILAVRKNSSFYISLLRIGEESGRLDMILMKLASYYKNKEEFKRRLVKTLTYPLIILSTTLMVSGYIIFFLLPSMISLMEGSGSEPSIIIKSILSFTVFVKENVYIFLYNVALAIAFLIITFIFLNNNYKIMSFIGRGFSFKLWQINFLRLLNMLLDSGCSIEHSLRIIIDNEKKDAEKKVLEEVYRSIISGNLLSTAIRDYSNMDKSIALLISLGEESGAIEKYIALCSDSLEKRYYEKLNRYIGLIQPAMLVFMGFIILFLVYSVFMPLINGVYQS